jgi:two-component system, response regulator PdtaR
MNEKQQNTPTVLLVEDEPLIRMVVSEFLTDQGLEVLEAGNAENALDILEERPDVRLLFTDINMPGSLDGVDLAREVHERWPELLLVLTTGYRMPPLARIPTGCEFVVKPYDFDRLADRINRMLHR